MLTKQQSMAVDTALSLLSTNSTILIQGRAGTGKTFMLKSLIEKLETKKIICSAPTHKAVEILREKIGMSLSVEFMTTHSALKLKRVIKRDGSVDFKPSYAQKYPPLDNIRYFIIDEASMLNTDLLDVAENHCKMQGCKLILIGDYNQINPVGEMESPAFNRNYPVITLTEIIRQGKDNPIIDLSMDLESIKSFKDNNFEDGRGYLYSSNRDKVIRSLIATNGSDELKYISYTNSDVDYINNAVRDGIYEGNPHRVEVGETIILSAPYKEVYFNNEEIKIRSIIIETGKYHVPCGPSRQDYKWVEVKYYSIVPERIRGEKEIMILHEDSDSIFKSASDKIKELCISGLIPWKEFYGFYESFANFKYNHAITVHKSQGSTYKKTIVNVGNIKFCKNEYEMQRLLYTAITRSKDLLILYNA